MSEVSYEKDGILGIVTLNNPPLNQINRKMADDLRDALDVIEKDDIRALVIRGAGDDFSAGADVNMFKGLAAAEARALLENFMMQLHRLEALPIPTLAIVKGTTMAGGLELALAFDMIWAADNTNMGQTEAFIGAATFGGGTQRLAVRCGAARALEIVYSGGIYSAEQFEQWNIVNAVQPLADLEDKAIKFAKRLAKGPTRAHAVTKRLLRSYLDGHMREADAILPAAAAELFETKDMRGAIESFLTRGPGRARFAGE